MWNYKGNVVYFMHGEKNYSMIILNSDFVLKEDFLEVYSPWGTKLRNSIKLEQCSF